MAWQTEQRSCQGLHALVKQLGHLPYAPGPHPGFSNYPFESRTSAVKHTYTKSAVAKYILLVCLFKFRVKLLQNAGQKTVELHREYTYVISLTHILIEIS